MEEETTTTSKRKGKSKGKKSKANDTKIFGSLDEFNKKIGDSATVFFGVTHKGGNDVSKSSNVNKKFINHQMVEDSRTAPPVAPIKYEDSEENNRTNRNSE